MHFLFNSFREGVCFKGQSIKEGSKQLGVEFLNVKHVNNLKFFNKDLV